MVAETVGCAVHDWNASVFLLAAVNIIRKDRDAIVDHRTCAGICAGNMDLTIGNADGQREVLEADILF